VSIISVLFSPSRLGKFVKARRIEKRILDIFSLDVDEFATSRT
jgi:hypothetical protein